MKGITEKKITRRSLETTMKIHKHTHTQKLRFYHIYKLNQAKTIT